MALCVPHYSRHGGDDDDEWEEVSVVEVAGGGLEEGKGKEGDGCQVDGGDVCVEC